MTEPAAKPAGRSPAFQLLALLLVLACGLAGTGLAYWLRVGDGKDKEKPPAMEVALRRAFSEWEKKPKKPDLVLVFTGQQLGYLLPCGCSRPQVGGLERRYNVLRALKKQFGWTVVPIDLGDVPQRHGPYDLPNLQGLIKYRYAMMAMKEMGYLATSLGVAEGALSLPTVLGEWALNEPKPRVVVSNLIDAGKHFPDQTRTFEWTNVGEVRLGVTAVLGPTVAEQVMGPATVALIQKAKDDPAARAELDRVPVRFQGSKEALDAVLNEMKGKKDDPAAGIELPVLLYQGPLTRNKMRRPPTEAVACAEAFPQFRLVVCLSDEDEPPHRPVFVTNEKTGARSQIILVGKKGKYIGVVGVWRTGKAGEFDFDYRPVEMTESFLTPEAEEKDHPIVRFMEEYTRELKRDNYLGKYGQIKHLLQALPEVPGLRNPGKPTYVGSEACKRCHASAYDVWKKSPHSHAYQALVEAKRPGNRQFDPECIVCHTVGFGYEGGFRGIDEKDPKDREKGTPHLKNVGCESCHGPASLHARHPDNEEWRKRLNPWRPLKAKENKDEFARRKRRMEEACIKCHDSDNDVNWVHEGFDKKWPKIAHPTPPDERRPPS